MDYDDDYGWLSDQEVWEREADYQREIDIAMELEWQERMEQREQILRTTPNDEGI